MSADVIPFKPKQQRSNGAREALIETLRDPASYCRGSWDTESAADYILLRMVLAGFVIVPLNVDLGA